MLEHDKFLDFGSLCALFIRISDSTDDQGSCFIVEVPRSTARFTEDKRVRSAGRVVRAEIQKCALSGRALKSTKLLGKPKFVTVSGQFFYDDWHIGDKPRGKNGCKSPTVAEIHPITAIKFKTCGH